MTTRPLVLAHRGASADAPENTIAAFELARAQGADGVELDVRIGRDGSLLVHHDPRLADGTAVADLTATDRPPELATLAEALGVLDGLLVNVEIKNGENEVGFDPTRSVADLVCAAIAAAATTSEIVVSSFDRACIERVRQADERLATAYLTVAVPPDLDDFVAGLARDGHGGLNPWFGSVSGELMLAARAQGLAVMPWTVDQPADQLRLAALRVDALITNVPAAARRVLGEWTDRV
jgi:glycerophosphoryl diester phosphodiesterase